MRIVFFGTGEFSTTILKGLINNGNNIVAVVSQPDKINGRNGKITFSSIKVFCLSNNIPIYQFEKLNKEGEQPLKALNADMFVTASYGQIIGEHILNIPRLGTFNVHASLLPKYRGSAPIQWAIINGEKSTGVTIMRTEAGIDTGEMYIQKEIPIEESDTSSSVFNKLAILGVECITEFINNFKQYEHSGIKQNEAEATYFPMIAKQDYLLNFNSSTTNIVNKVRALENCFFVYSGARYKVLEVAKSNLSGGAGELLACNAKQGLIVGSADGSVEIVTIQPEGKQKMPAKAYMNSNKFKLGDVIENS
mgnify:CR=1 FL=1